MKPIDDIERQVVEEVLKHEATKSRADEVLGTFKNGTNSTRSILNSYKRAEAARKKTP